MNDFDNLLDALQHLLFLTEKFKEQMNYEERREWSAINDYAEKLRNQE